MTDKLSSPPDISREIRIVPSESKDKETEQSVQKGNIAVKKDEINSNERDPVLSVLPLLSGIGDALALGGIIAFIGDLITNDDSPIGKIWDTCVGCCLIPFIALILILLAPLFMGLIAAYMAFNEANGALHIMIFGIMYILGFSALLMSFLPIFIILIGIIRAIDDWVIGVPIILYGILFLSLNFLPYPLKRKVHNLSWVLMLLGGIGISFFGDKPPIYGPICLVCTAIWALLIHFSWNPKEAT